MTLLGKRLSAFQTSEESFDSSDVFPILSRLSLFSLRFSSDSPLLFFDSSPFFFHIRCLWPEVPEEVQAKATTKMTGFLPPLLYHTQKIPRLATSVTRRGILFWDRVEGRKARREMELAPYFTSSKSTYSLSSLVKIFSCCRPVWVSAELLPVFWRAAFCCSRALKSARVC